MGEHVQPEATDRDRHDGGQCEAPCGAGQSPPDEHHADEGDGVDHHAAELHAPGRRTGEPVERSDEVERPRPRVTALVGEVADPARQADPRGESSTDVSHAELGHREVEHRRPRSPQQRDDGDHEWQHDQGCGRADRSSRHVVHHRGG